MQIGKADRRGELGGPDPAGRVAERAADREHVAAVPAGRPRGRAAVGPVGRHRLRLVNPVLKRSASVEVEVDAATSRPYRVAL